MKHNIPQHHKIFLFNGTLNYTPNLNALKNILHNLSPLLQQQIKDYTIVICGSKLPADLNNLLDYKNQNIIYAGFVDDIKQYFLAANVFINPVVDGGGIKTKIVEALGYDLSLVTTKSGAIGVPENITKNKMIVVADNDWKSFANALETIDIDVSISQDYFNHFYWGNIAEKGATVISNL
jgi:glycosyltransferase involved in cell wall biosynthesis